MNLYTHTNSPINNFTQISGPIKNNMGVKLLIGEFVLTPMLGICVIIVFSME